MQHPLGDIALAALLDQLDQPVPFQLAQVAGPSRTLALAQLTNAIGDGAYLVTSALYFTRVAGAWEISFYLAPPDKHGQYQGFFGTGAAAARMVGPALLTGLIITGRTAGWLVFGGLFLLAAGAMGPAVRWADRTALTPMAAGRPPSTSDDGAADLGRAEARR